jgi:23S rRNA pseudouridine1911/1915/1917 synthase
MTINVDDNDIRIDKYISDNSEFSREYVNKLISNGFVLVNNKSIKPSYKVKSGDIIDIHDGLKKEIINAKENIKLDIVYEDDYLMVINKPSGLVVHPGNGNAEHTLVNALLYYTDDLSDSSGVDRAGIVHRLDKDTSGLMLVAKTNKAHELLADDFKNKRIKREYLALVNGVFPSATAKIDAPIGRSKKDFRMMEVTASGKKAVTNVRVEKHYKKYTLLRLSLETGRTHQIRCHLAYIGYPVYNDPVYSKNSNSEFGQFLHSTSIDFVHPITKKHLHFECDVPQEFKDMLNTLEQE